MSSQRSAKRVTRTTTITVAVLSLAVLAAVTGGPRGQHGLTSGASANPRHFAQSVAADATLDSYRVTPAGQGWWDHPRPPRRHHLPAPGHRRGHGGYQGTDPPLIARALLAKFGWSRGQFRYLDRLWALESGWNPRAYNPGSGAYGIPQADPGAKMGAYGPGWRWRPRTQILWGLHYIAGLYRSPRAAWAHECDYGWY